MRQDLMELNFCRKYLEDLKDKFEDLMMVFSDIRMLLYDIHLMKEMRLFF